MAGFNEASSDTSMDTSESEGVLVHIVIHSYF